MGDEYERIKSYNWHQNKYKVHKDETAPFRHNGNDTLSVSFVSSLLCHFVSVALIAENAASRKKLGVGNESRVFSVFVVLSGYSVLSLIQNTARDFASNILLRSPSFAISSSRFSRMLDAPGLFTNGFRINFFAFCGSVVVGNSFKTTDR